MKDVLRYLNRIMNKNSKRNYRKIAMGKKEEIAREQAIDYLLDVGFDRASFNQTQTDITGYFLQDFFEGALNRMTKKQERVLGHDRVCAVGFLKGAIDLLRLTSEGPSWLDLPEGKPTATLIQDECGVKTYEVDGSSEKFKDTFEQKGPANRNFKLFVIKKVWHDGSGVAFDILSAPHAGEFKTKNCNTAKQALEQLGYEVKE